MASHKLKTTKKVLTIHDLYSCMSFFLRVLFTGEVVGFLNPLGEGISAGVESGYCAAFAVMEHFDNPSMIVRHIGKAR